MVDKAAAAGLLMLAMVVEAQSFITAILCRLLPVTHTLLLLARVVLAVYDLRLKDVQGATAHLIRLFWLRVGSQPQQV